MEEFGHIIEQVAAQLSREDIANAQAKAEVLKGIEVVHQAKLRMIAWDQE